MTYTRKTATRPATAAKAAVAWIPAAELAYMVGVAVADGEVTFFGGVTYPVPDGAGAGEATDGADGWTVMVL
jgi:hypothetical protein